jgi:phosphonate transport system substrate-binding protein
MRRAVIAATALVALLFASLLIPGAPAARWLMRGMTGRSSSPAPALEATAAPGHPLRVAVGAMISPERTFASYGELFAEMARRLGRPVDILQRRTYAEVNQLIEHGEVDLAWVCTGAWPPLARSRAARLLAVPVVNEQTTYRAVILVGPSCRARTLAELRGVRFAFTDALSLTGYAYPRRRLAGLGLGADRFFSGTLFTHGHDTSIETVRRGFADAASVDELVFDFLRQRHPEEVEGVRVIEHSEPFPIPPLAVPTSLSEADFRLFQRVLLELDRDPRGRDLLQQLLVDRFAKPNESAYLELP